MLIINPDPFLTPTYRISPFVTADITKNYELPESNNIDTYFSERFSDRTYTYTINGRSAINKALSHYKLQKEDIVTILTTSNNFYVSSCVTSEIEKICRWTREISSKTKILFVIHEFGFPYARISDLKKFNIPIIEDCAYSFFSEDNTGGFETTGDFLIYSFPKMFPIQIGGLLVYKKEIEVEQESWTNNDYLPYIKKVMSSEIRRKNDIIRKRIENYNYFTLSLKAMGFEERFMIAKGNVPGVFMFTVPDEGVNLQDMRNYLFQHGIQCGVFYTERAFFIPNHQALGNYDLAYFVLVIQTFLGQLAKLT